MGAILRSGFAALCVLAMTATGAGAFELDERPGEPGEWGFRPVEGETVAMNPPGFTWRPVEGAMDYDFEVYEGEDASGRLCFGQENALWNAVCPSITFEPGAYVWRYRARDEQGDVTDWSSLRAFVIASSSVPFPKPGRLDAVSRIPKDHPRLFLRPEEVQKFRVMQYGSHRSQMDDLERRSRNLIDNPPDTSEPPLYPEGIEHKGEEWKEIWWGNRKRTIAVVDSAATLGFAYLMTGNPEYGEAGRDLLMGFADWDPKGSTQYDYNDEAGMPALYFPSRAYTWLYPMLSDDDRAKIESVMAVRGEDCFNHLRKRNHLWRPYASHSNRAWHFLGEVAIAFIDTIPDAPMWLDYTNTVFYTAYPVWSDTDGGWHEGMAYWSSYISRFMYWAFVSKSAFGEDVFERPFFRQTGYYGMYVAPPGTKTGGLGDLAQFSGADRLGSLMAVLAVGARNPHWMWYANDLGADLGDGYLGYIYAARARNLNAEPPVDLPSSMVFEGVGFAVLNSNLLEGTRNTQIHFKSSPLGRQSHGHDANNAFLLNVNGERVFISSGRRDVHGSPHHREWMWHSKADNAILVNGEGQVKHSASAVGRITAFRTSERMDVVIGEAGDSYENLDRWTRRIAFYKPDVIVIHDVLEAPEPSTFTWTLHGVAPFEIEGNTASMAHHGGTAHVSIQASAPLTLSQTDTFDVPPHEWAFELDEWHLAATTTEKRRKMSFFTVITPRKPIANMVESGGGIRVPSEAAGGRRTLVVMTPGVAMDEAPVTGMSRGRFAVNWKDVAWEFGEE